MQIVVALLVSLEIEVEDQEEGNRREVKSERKKVKSEECEEGKWKKKKDEESQTTGLS
jgi:hypothetical protein